MNSPMNLESAKDAFSIQQGACNPRAIARAIVRAVDDAVDHGGSRVAGQSPAVRLMLHQLAWVLWGSDPYDQPMFPGCDWVTDHEACRTTATAPAVQIEEVAA